MSYSKKTWVTGETVKAEYLNNMENGIEDNSTDIASEIKRATQAEESIRDSIPTKTSDLSNDSGYKTTDTNTTYTLTKEGNQIVLNGSDGSKSNVLDNSGINDLSNYYTKSEVDSKLNNKANLSDLTEVTNSFATKAEVANNHYKKSETYNRSEIDSKIASAGSGGPIDLSNYVDKTSQQDITGNKTFTGNFTIGGKLCDKQASQGTAGQILSSTGDGIEWINAPSGGNSENSEYAEKLGTPDEYLKIGEISDGETTYPTPILVTNDTEIVVATEHILAKFTTLMQQMFSGEIDSKLASELDNYYDKTNTDLQISSRLANYYDKKYIDDYLYTKSQVDTELAKKTSNTEFTSFTQKVANTYETKTNASNTYAKKTELFSKNYNDLTNKPTIPTKTSQLTNNSGFLTSHQDISGKADKSTTYTKSEVDQKIGVAVFDVQESVENEIIPRLTYSKSEIDSKIANVGGNGSGSATYERVTEMITLSSPSADMPCQTLYVKVDEEILSGDKALLGIFADEFEVWFRNDGDYVVEIQDVSQFSCELIETGVYSFKLPNAMSGGYIVPETDTSNRAYFVNRVEAEVKTPAGKDYGYTATLEREDVEIDVNKVYTLNASQWDYQARSNFILTDNGKPLELDKVYTLKVLNFFMPQYTNEETIDIAALFRMKLEGGLTESGTGEGRTFAWSDENGEAMGVGYCHLDSGFDISGVVEITFWTDDTASCYVLLSPFATSEW